MQYVVVRISAGVDFRAGILSAKAETPLLRFVVDFSDNKSYNKLWNISTCWDAVDVLQAFDLIRTRAVQLPDLLQTCAGFVVQHVVRQIHDKWTRMEFGYEWKRGSGKPKARWLNSRMIIMRRR